MARIIDLDEALPPDITVKLGGKSYRLPGDIPTPLFLRIQQATGSLGTDDDGITALADAILDLFRTRDPSLTELPLGLTQMVTLFSTVYGVQAEGEDDDPPTGRTRGTGTSSRSSRPKSRS